MQFTELKDYRYTGELDEVVLQLKVYPIVLDSTISFTLKAKGKNRIDALQALIRNINESIARLNEAKNIIENAG